MIDGLSVQASAFTEANIVDVGSYEELKAAVAERKWARGPWAGHALPSHCFQTF
jgi:prolyl-tRNA synthetase